MPVTFARLRIAGFKSFAEPVSLEILPGLTGIVGPNGCGKSNVVEALRWCMGESSARSLRGAEMDDLIFAGSASRPRRNLAEVVLTLEDAAGLAPPPLHEQAELQVNRSIERGAGSAYRINGREVRARDVQTLFADLGSGARASAMVSQGRVASIVGARPDERRVVLEEAAGITGLHARRHEAEAKLRAAEANLARAEDLRLRLEQQAASLTGQAEQAARYRVVAAELRDGETALLALLHARATRAVQQAGAARQEAARSCEAAGAACALAVQREQQLAAGLSAPREAEVLARTLLDRHRIGAEGAARDSERTLLDCEAAERRLGMAKGDHEAAEARLEDANSQAGRLRVEQDALRTQLEALPEQLDAAERQHRAAAEAVGNADGAHRRHAALAVEAETRQAGHGRDEAAASDRLARATILLERIGSDRRQAEAQLPRPALLRELEAALAGAQTVLHEAQTALDLRIPEHSSAARLAQANRLAAADAVRRHRAALQAETEAKARVERAAREIAALEERLAEAEQDRVSDGEQQRARAGVLAAEQALSATAEALALSESARAAATAARVEAQARSRDAARHRALASAEAHRAEAAWAGLAAEHARASRDHETAARAALPDGMLSAAVAARADAEAELATIATALREAETRHADAQETLDGDAEALAALRDASARLAAEADGLAQALAAEKDDDADATAATTLGAQLSVPSGLEQAVAALLADGLDAGCVDDAPRRWLLLPPLPPEPLPTQAVALSTLVGAPSQLDRALCRAGLVASAQDGDALQPSLQPGQCLVTRNGALWRWDGYRIAGGQPGPAAIRLQQRARHRDTLTRLAQSRALLEPADATLQRSLLLREAAVAALQALRRDRSGIEQVLAERRDRESRLALADAQNRARLQSLAPLLSRAETLLSEAQAARDAAAAALAALPTPEQPEAEAARAARVEAEAAETERTARLRRGKAEAALQDARAAETALAARQARHETTRRALAPALARLHDENRAAGLALQQVTGLAGSIMPDRAMLAAAEADAAADRAQAAEQAARTRRDAARIGAAEQQAERDRIAAAMRDGAARLAAFDGRHASASDEHASAAAAAAELAASARTLPDAALAASRAAESAAALESARDRERAAMQTLTGLRAGHAALRTRPDALRSAAEDWNRRLEAARAAEAAAARRLAEAERDAQARRIDPAAEASRLRAIEAALAKADADAIAASRRREQAEADVLAAQSDRRAVESALAAAREARLRAEARAEQARDTLSRLLAEHPEPLPATMAVDTGTAAEAALRRRIAGLARERDAIGPVNLRADLELSQLGAEMEAIARERQEIETAIGRLRGQIGQLDREGRERLLAVFEQVDRHFRLLFARMFSGGRAHLGMVGSDDPLQAGLEIYAQPPGKKLATLSLLSGGEQALTALSLVFAVSRCNPAPICILDEVDAPLDDANVERFCALLADMARETGTRFLVVTHHQLTMAHMDRLYGVTMQERGVSRVLSVDMAGAAAMAG